MSSIFIYSGAFILIYGLIIYIWNKKVEWRAGLKFSKKIKSFHYSLLLFTAIITILNAFFSITFIGYWTPRIIILGFLLSGVIAFPIIKWNSESSFEKYYFRLFSFLPFAIAGISMVQFLGTVITLSLYYRLVNPYEKIYYQDKNLRVQSTFTGVLAPLRFRCNRKVWSIREKIKRITPKR
ncbi:MAG: hypothetical protein KF856_01805 [Cyclobacteriaceae bacterium]|nr:hypothetical protein [Cyclobacteriaceae bacterium]